MRTPVSIDYRLTPGSAPGQWRVELVGGDEGALSALPLDWLPWLAVGAAPAGAEAWAFLRSGDFSIAARSWADGDATLARVVLSPPDADDDADALLREREVPGANDRSAARSLLAHLSGAMHAGLPVVIAAPADDFLPPARMARIARFVYRALPPALKRRCRVRVLTRDPALFLGPLAADLIAIPIEDAAAALMTRRDAILLDRDANLVEGAPPPPAALAYAAQMTDAAARSGDTMRELARRVGVLMPDAPIPDAAQLAALPVLRALSEPGAPIPALGPDAQDLDWSRILISDADWERLPMAMFDAVVPSCPREAVERLLASDEWPQWRARTLCGPEARRAAAKAWCASRIWLRGAQPRWEDWTWVLRDLGPALSASDLEQMRGGAGFFPLISWFEREQLEQLRGLADPQAAAVLTGVAVEARAEHDRAADREAGEGAAVEPGESLAASEPRGVVQGLRDWLRRLFGRKRAGESDE